jgi:dihydrofolate reductase
MEAEDSNNRFKVKLIVAVCKGGGIGINNKLPWKISDDLRYFSALTSGDYGKYMKDTKRYISTGKTAAKICKDDLNIKKNVIIMGKNTWLSLPNHPKPLPYRDSIVLSTTIPESKVLRSWVYESDYDLNLHFSSISRAIRFCSFGGGNEERGSSGEGDFYRSEKHDERQERENLFNSDHKIYNDIWIIGGSKVYESIMDMNINADMNANNDIIIDEFYITYIDKEYKCDTFFPLIENMNLYCVTSIEAKVCKCEDDGGISEVNVYYLVFKRGDKTEMVDGMFNIDPSIATNENIELIKRLKIGIWRTS